MNTLNWTINRLNELFKGKDTTHYSFVFNDLNKIEKLYYQMSNADDQYDISLKLYDVNLKLFDKIVYLICRLELEFKSPLSKSVITILDKSLTRLIAVEKI